jgi:ABC-type antimicrobial peptide transport system permease subunit
MRSPSLWFGAVLVGTIVLVAAFALWLSSYGPDVMDMSNRLSRPSWEHVSVRTISVATYGPASPTGRGSRSR